MPLEEEAEAEGSLRLRPPGSPHTAAADHHLAVCGITEERYICIESDLLAMRMITYPIAVNAYVFRA